MPPEQQAPDPAAPMTPEQKAELQQLLGLVKSGYQKWNTMKFSLQNKTQSAKNDQLKRVFQLFMSQGIDLKDPKAVGVFLQQIKQKDPAQYTAVEKALDYLLGTNNYESTDSTQPAQGPSDLSQGTSQAPDPQAPVQGVS